MSCKCREWEAALLTDRKNQHLQLVLEGKGAAAPGISTGFERFAFEHIALPEISLEDVDIGTHFLGKRMSAPLLVSSMTGGPARAAAINANLAEACEALGIALAVGSQRVAIEGASASGLGLDLRQRAPTIPILANFGAAQLNLGYGPDEARRAVEMIGADALIIHLNPLQEAVQPEGDRDWRGLLMRIEALARVLEVPIAAKEVGSGITGALARRLVDCGVAVIDVAGAGGTSWAAVEAGRARNPSEAAIASAFAGWGQSTSDAILSVREACSDAVIVGSGGIRDGIDVAKAIRLGADIAGQAAGVLAAANTSPEAIVEHFGIVIAQLRIACFCTGSADLSALRRAPIHRVPSALPESLFAR
ncbi:type 2 isopentenyl-diphosphate Delta-isomerase [Arsenicitalea aurantiaca]|uniref:Isopentenyl-diphosphate delta-isomerase n=1 Tax=Arsenicitalea aurantiaca TaxID=1783274 RepID=A0A433XF89_9HYPH|nr:type 2 isopentenyl-diphosphate Delta-isomerase [Arsenicitalea aurantiaca]RUT32769.1 type 2 isopentenyl-diphosphate Delta-isomerase [Arsenicitalea aurantiaca]